MPITHHPKAGAHLTGTEWETDLHTAPTLAEVLVAGNDANSGTITNLTLIDGGQAGGTGGNAALTLSQSVGTEGGASSVSGGNADTAGIGGYGQIAGGNGDNGNASGAYVLAAGGAADDTGGRVEIGTGSAYASGKSGGDLVVLLGAGDGAGRNGLVFLNLPTSDPGVSGALWNSGGTVKVS